MTIEEIYQIPADILGWRQCPSGAWVSIGQGVKIGREVTFGHWMRFGDYVEVGDYVEFGRGVMLGEATEVGDGAIFCDWVIVGAGTKVGAGGWLGPSVTLGNNVTLGKNVKLGAGVRLHDMVRVGDDMTWMESPLQIQGSKHLVYVCDRSLIGIGCICQTAEWWNEHYADVGRRKHYSEGQVKEYRKWLDIAIEWQAALPKEAPSGE